MDHVMTPEVALPRMRATLDRGEPLRLVVTGTSMAPFLRHKKDAVILTSFDGTPNPGDILFYVLDNGRPLLHRFHRVLPDGRYLICGDHLLGLEHVRPDQVWARAVQLQRGQTLFSADAGWWRLLSRLWIALFPLRRPLLAVLHALWRAKQKLRRARAS